jgi:RNA polymerase sigma-70 factor (ECF subfamily)
MKAEELLDRLAGRDVEALSSLYDEFAPRLMGLLMHILPAKAEAESTLREVFLRLWKEAAHIGQSKGSLAAWLVLVARYVAFQRLRTQRGGPVRPAQGPYGQSRAKGERPAAKPADLTLEGEKTGKRRSPTRESGILPFLIAFPQVWMPRPEDIALVDARTALLQRAFEQIPKPQRRALELTLFGGFSEPEIAEQLGEPLGKVRASLRAAFTFMRHRQYAVLGTWTADI